MNYFGIANNCNQKAMQLNPKQYEKDPHNGPHEIMDFMKIVKKLNDMKIGSFGTLLKQYEKQLHEKIDAFFTDFKASMTKKLFSAMCTRVSVQKTEFSEQIFSNLRKLADFDFTDITCHNFWQVIKSFDSSVKSKEIQFMAEKFIENFMRKTKLIDQIFNKKDDLSILMPTSSILSVSLDSSKESQPPKSPKKSAERSISDDAKKEKQQQQKNKESQIKIQFTDCSNFYAKQQLFTDKQTQCQEKKEKNIVKKQSKNQDEDFSLSSLDLSEILKKQQSEKQQQEEQPKPKKQEKQGKEEVSQKNPAKSYLAQQEARVYTKVIRLKDPKYLENQEQSFNIRLKVIQQLLFRLQKVTHSSDNNEKTYKKVKFLAGDETGNVICFTNIIPQISKGQFVTLNDCRLTKFHDSYQISSSKCKQLNLSKNFESFQTNIGNPCISQLICRNPIIYVAQHYDSCWPSIRGLAYLNHEKCNKIQLVATISWILDIGDKYVQCHIHDGTGRVRALIDKQQCPKLEQGKTYLFRKLVIFPDKNQDQHILTVKSADLKKSEKKKYCPIVVQQFKYDIHLLDSVEAVVSEIRK